MSVQTIPFHKFLKYYITAGVLAWRKYKWMKTTLVSLDKIFTEQQSCLCLLEFQHNVSHKRISWNSSDNLCVCFYDTDVSLAN